MLEIFLGEWQIALLVMIGAYGVHRLALWGSVESVLAPIHLHAVIMSITVGMLACLWKTGVMSDNDAILLALFFLCAWLGLLAGNLFCCVQGRSFQMTIRQRKIAGIDLAVIIVVAGLGLMASMALSVFLWACGSTGDDRIVVQKEFRFIDIFRQAGLGLGISGLWFACLYDLRLWVRQMSFLAIVMFAVVGLFSGSKSMALTLAVPYLVLVSMMSHEHPARRLHGRLTVAVATMALIGLFGAFVAKSMLMQDKVSPILLFADRVAATADAYDYAFRDGAINSLVDRYSPISYVMHPYLKLLGMSGYEYPLGVALFEYRTGDASGYGPNANLPLLGFVFFGSSAWVFMIIMGLLVGAYIPIARLISMKSLTGNRLGTVIPLVPMCVFYLPSLMIYADIGLFSQQLICNLGVLFVVWFSLLMILFGCNLHFIRSPVECCMQAAPPSCSSCTPSRTRPIALT